MYNDYTQTVIISWEEYVVMNKELAEKVAIRYDNQSIRPLSKEAIIPCAILCETLGWEFSLTSGLRFDIVDRNTTDMALFEVMSDNPTMSTTVSTIYKNNNNQEQKIVLPWQGSLEYTAFTSYNNNRR